MQYEAAGACHWTKIGYGHSVIGIISLALSISTAAVAQDEVTRGTLSNHMRVVIVRNTLAPTVTVTENYLAGADETPEGFPGIAHAQEHMMSRGCSGLSADQISAIFAQLGGGDNAQTGRSSRSISKPYPRRILRLRCAWTQRVCAG